MKDDIDITNSDGVSIGAVRSQRIPDPNDVSRTILCVAMEIGPFTFGFDSTAARNLSAALLVAAELTDARVKGMH